MHHLHTGGIRQVDLIYLQYQNNAIYIQDMVVLCIYFKIKLIIIYASEEDHDYSVI